MTTTTPALPDERMRELGFTDHRPTHWFYSVGIGHETAFTITIDKATREYEELIEDVAFGQPAFYGNMREPYRTQFHARIEEQLAKLRAAGFTVTVDHTLYGWDDSESLPFDFAAVHDQVAKIVIPEGAGVRKRRDLTAAIEQTIAALHSAGRIVPDGVTLRQEWHSVVIDNATGDDWDETDADSPAEAQKHIDDWLANENNDLEDGTRLTIRSRWTADSPWAELS